MNWQLTWIVIAMPILVFIPEYFSANAGRF
jgi:hypothetical protein